VAGARRPLWVDGDDDCEVWIKAANYLKLIYPIKGLGGRRFLLACAVSMRLACSKTLTTTPRISAKF